MREITLFVFRHGETDWNAEGRFQGHLDIPLNEKGRDQARALGQRLKCEAIEALVASDLSRSIQTAEIVADAIGLNSAKIYRSREIKEAFLGQAQGLTLDEIRAQFGAAVLQRWRSNDVTDADISYPGGETGSEVLARTVRGLQEFVKSNPEFQRIGVSSHGGVIRRLMHWIIANSIGAAAASHVPIPNGVVYEIVYCPDTSSWCIARPL